MDENAPYIPRQYFAMALDPIHVGTGGYRLGEVDMTIVREPGTDLPKIPATSLEGAARAYTAIKTGRYQIPIDDQPVKNSSTKSMKSCAGKGGEDGADHCGLIDCPVCVPYGFTIGSQNRSFHGLAQFYDARILFFPVRSIDGPIWVSTPSILSELSQGELSVPMLESETIYTFSDSDIRLSDTKKSLNLGWLLLKLDTIKNWTTLTIKTALKFPDTVSFLDTILSRLVLVEEKLFPLVVNSNLEVRTSVSINPATGAADDGALFTYEAMPRATVLHFPILYQNPALFMFPQPAGNKQIRLEAFGTTRYGEAQNTLWVVEQVRKGLDLMKYLGIGGMRSRGFGRLEIIYLDETNENGGKS